MQDMILFSQMSNPQVVKLYCMCLRTMKLWLKWLWKAEVPQWDMFPELIELLLIGCSIEFNPDPKIQNQIHRHQEPICRHLEQRGILHVMNGIICWPLFSISHVGSTCLHHSDGETSSTRIGRRTCYSQITTYDEFDLKNAFVHVFFSFINPRGGPRMDIKILKDMFLTIEPGNLLKRQDQSISKMIMVYPCLLKRGKVEMENTIRETWGKFLGFIA